MIWIIIVGLLTGVAAGGESGDPPPTCAGEHALPAAERIVRIARFVEWPDDDHDASYRIGLAGGDRMSDDVFQLLERMRIRERPIEVVRVTAPADMLRCHLVYFGAAERKHITALVDGLRGSRVLTVAAIPGFLDMGGMVELPDSGCPKVASINVILVRGSGIVLKPSLLGVVSVRRPR